MARDDASILNVDDLLAAYALGYFPMARARHEADVVWVLPDQRGVLPLNEARAPKKLLRFLRRCPFELRMNTAFQQVIEACAAPTPGREETWINDAIIETYCDLHFRGHAHSVECWNGNALVGGLYGIAIGGIFCGESMFSKEPNASKIAMLHLIARLKLAGFSLLDTQFHTEHLAQFGVREMPNNVYQDELRKLIQVKADFTQPPANSSAEILSSTIYVWQSMTQTS